MIINVKYKKNSLSLSTKIINTNLNYLHTGCSKINASWFIMLATMSDVGGVATGLSLSNNNP